MKMVTAANGITLLRIVGTLALFFFEPLTFPFLLLYGLTGVTDVLDGYVARLTGTAGGFGARLDSAADLIFYVVTVVRLLPVLIPLLPSGLWTAIVVILGLRILSYLMTALRFHTFAALHTYLNKATGAVVFLMPYFLNHAPALPYCTAAVILAGLSTVEELLIHLGPGPYDPERKSLFHRSTQKHHTDEIARSSGTEASCPEDSSGCRFRVPKR